MRIFLAGDYRTGSGPANVTKEYIGHLPKGTLFQKMRNKAARVPEIVFKTLMADIVIYSGYSKQNIIGLKLARRLKRPSAYLMHGCVEHENRINREEDPEMTRVERSTIELADKVYAVSASFEKWLKDFYPEHADKFDHVTNGIDISLMCGREGASYRDPFGIISIGGGMPRKKIVNICRAIESLHNKAIKLTVLGAKGADSDEINAFPFVENKGLISHDEAMELLSASALFIQDSCFESFGLAPLEALMRGCAVLISKEAGLLEYFGETEPGDLIEDCDDITEIADKINILLDSSNNRRLIASLDTDDAGWDARADELREKLYEQVKISGK